ncbi:MAG: flagellar motor switch protein FliN [Pirellulales bacterium]
MADDSKKIDQDEVEELLKQAQGEATPSGGDAPSASLNPEEASALRDSAEHSSRHSSTTETQCEVQDAATAASRAAKNPTVDSAGSGPASISPGDIEYLIQQAEQAISSIDEPLDTNRELQGISAYRFQQFSGSPASTEVATLDLMREVELDLKIELGRTQMYLEEVLKLKKGSVVPLDKLAGDPVDIYVNGRLIARGEVLVLNDNFCVRVGELIVAEPAAT